MDRVQPLRLTVGQPSLEGVDVIEDLDTDSRVWGDPIVRSYASDGPAVLVVAVGKRLDNTVQRYALQHQARETRSLFVPLHDRPLRKLSPEQICSLAQWTVDQLARLNDRGAEKHLILLGPASLATRIGAAAHGTGRTWMPFWDGGSGYVSGLMIG